MKRALSWYLRRHSFLFKIRYRLVSKTASLNRIECFCYNDNNPKTDIPILFHNFNNVIFKKINNDFSDFKKAKKIAIWLRNNSKGGPGIGKSSEYALRKMTQGEGGVCSDFAQVFNNFCVINDLKVKEWGIKIDSPQPSIAGGHSFNEFYSKELRKWILIDVSKSIYFYQSNPKLPLSAIELLYLKNKNKKINFKSFNKKIAIDTNRITDLYLTPFSSLFVITNYCNKTYDYYLTKLKFFPESVVHGLVFLSGSSYSFEFPIHNN
jgi:hypothetical protein